MKRAQNHVGLFFFAIFERSPFEFPCSASVGKAVDIGYLIDGIYIRFENSLISIIPGKERGGWKRQQLGG